MTKTASAHPMRFLKVAIAAGAATAAIGGSSVVAFAYPTPRDHQSADCDPSRIDPGKPCSLVFVNQNKVGKGVPGSTICYTVSPANAGTMTPSCSTTNANGRAKAVFHSVTRNCPSPTDPRRYVTITGREQGDFEDVARTKVQVKCDSKQVEVQPVDNSGLKPPPAAPRPTRLMGLNASSPLAIDGPTNTVSGTMLGVGILGFIVVMSVAITGRLRLRRFRR